MYSLIEKIFIQRWAVSHQMELMVCLWQSDPLVKSPDGTIGLALTEWPTTFSLDSNSILWETPVTGRQKASFEETFLWCSNSDCFPSFHQIITDRIEYKTHSLALTKSLAIVSLTYRLILYHWNGLTVWIWPGGPLTCRTALWGMRWLTPAPWRWRFFCLLLSVHWRCRHLNVKINRD